MRLVSYIKKRIRRFIGNEDIYKEVELLHKEVELLSAQFTDLSKTASLVATISTAKYIEENMVIAEPLGSKFEVFDFCFSREDKLPEGLVCEFGVFEGETINYIAKKNKCDVFGFDSFEGLPENWRYGFKKGAFNMDEKRLYKYEDNVQLVRGWFDKTLPDFLLKHPDPVSFLHIDCDLYSSTKTVFDLLSNRLLSGTIIVFDEYFNYPGWKQNEYLAFSEFIDKSNLNYEYLCYNKFHEQVAVRLL